MNMLRMMSVRAIDSSEAKDSRRVFIFIEPFPP
jgi:hypothetical protein